MTAGSATAEGESSKDGKFFAMVDAVGGGGGARLWLKYMEFGHHNIMPTVDSQWPLRLLQLSHGRSSCGQTNGHTWRLYVNLGTST